MSEHAYDPGLKAVEAALARLSPAAAAVDRDRLMFRAGQASRPPHLWAWRGATAALLLLSASLTAVLLLRPHEVRYVEKPPPPPTPDVAPPSAPSGLAAASGLAEYHRLQERLLQHGLDGLPPPTPAPPTTTDDLDELFGPGPWSRPGRSGS
jgi:hypothetical protein